jgi:hypothetical protein
MLCLVFKNQVLLYCEQETLLELWANEGEFTERSDREIENLTQDQILDKVNNWQYSELYLMGKTLILCIRLQNKPTGNVVHEKHSIVKSTGCRSRILITHS